MNIEEVREYCIAKKGVTESFPFDNETLVFKVMDKMFALLSLNDARVNLKCDPDEAVRLRAVYEDVIPGYHMNKQHWNTINLRGNVPSDEILGWIDDSYNLIVNGLPAKKRNLLNEM